MSDLPAYGMEFQDDDAPEYSQEWYKKQLDMCEKELEKLFCDNDLLQADNERLRAGIKDVAAKFAEMEKLRGQFYTEKEQAETALLFANRERDALQKRVDDAHLKLRSVSGMGARWVSYSTSEDKRKIGKVVCDAIGILTGEGE